jgi:transcriptional regulator with XRE-family HTH domain
MKSKLSETLGKLRREKGLSQRQAATELGISQALLSHYENDAREPKLEFVLKACEYYSVTADYLIGRTDERGDGSSKLAGKVSGIIDSLKVLKAEEAELLEKLRVTVNTSTENGA